MGRASDYIYLYDEFRGQIFVIPKGNGTLLVPHSSRRTFILKEPTGVIPNIIKMNSKKGKFRISRRKISIPLIF